MTIAPGLDVRAAGLGIAALVLMPNLAQAAPDITIATIAAGRLYVAGSAGAPNLAVVLEDRFRAEADATGRFQFEETYHPARCIVGVRIDGRTYEAVVGNCGQQGPPGPGRLAATPPAPAVPAAAPIPLSAPPAPAAAPAPVAAVPAAARAAPVKRPTPVPAQVKRPPPRPKPARGPRPGREDGPDSAAAPPAE